MGFTDFPLYEQLYSSTDDSFLSSEEQIQLLNEIKHMNSNEHEIVYTLIRVHQLETNMASNGVLPFDGRYMKRDGGIKFQLDKLPKKLQRILHAFSLRLIQSRKSN